MRQGKNITTGGGAGVNGPCCSATLAASRRSRPLHKPWPSRAKELRRKPIAVSRRPDRGNDALQRRSVNEITETSQRKLAERLAVAPQPLSRSNPTADPSAVPLAMVPLQESSTLCSTHTARWQGRDGCTEQPLGADRSRHHQRKGRLGLKAPFATPSLPVREHPREWATGPRPTPDPPTATSWHTPAQPFDHRGACSALRTPPHAWPPIVYHPVGGPAAGAGLGTRCARSNAY